MLIALLATLLATATVEAPRVQVTRREVTVIFPHAVTPRGGWTVPDASGPEWTQYGWWVTEPADPRADFAGRPTLVAFEIRRDSTRSRAFSSLAAVVAEAQPSRCFGGMIRLCFPTTWRASVQDGRVVLRLADSVAIDSVFGRRPRTLRLSRHVPPDTAWSLDVSIDYRDPQLPARSVQIATARRATMPLKSVSQTDWLDGGDFWISVGDSQEVSLAGIFCIGGERCGEGSSMGTGTFRVRNPRIAVLRPRAAYVRLARLHAELEARTAESPVQLFAVAPGVTTIVYQERESRGIDATGARLPPRRLDRDVHVTTPLRGIRIEPRPVRAPTHRALRISVVAIDREGRTHPGVEPELDVIVGAGYTIEAHRTVTFNQPGRVILVATFRDFADTLRIVVDSSAKSSDPRQ